MARVILNQNQTYVSDADDIITQIGNLSDVFITSAANGDILVYNDSLSRWENSPNSELTSLNALSDVEITTPSNGSVLVYDDADEEWKNSNELRIREDISITHSNSSFFGISREASDSELFVANTEENGTDCGSLAFYGQNSNYDPSYIAGFKYAEIRGLIDDNTEDAHTGSLLFQLSEAGNLETKVDLTISELRANLQTVKISNGGGTPYLYFNNNNSGIENGDYLGAFIFTDNNGYEYADIGAKLIDNTTGNETSNFTIFNSSNGNFKQCLNIEGEFDETQFTTEFVSHYHNESTGPRFYLINSNDPGVNGHSSGVFHFGGYSDTGSYQNYAIIETLMDDTTDGAENAAMLLRTVTNGTVETKIEIGASEINVNNAQVIINDKIKVNGAIYDDFTVVRAGSGNYAANIASNINANLANGDRSSFIGFEIQTNTDWAYPGLIGSEYNEPGTNNGNKILLQVYDDGVSSFTRNTVFEAAEERVVAYRPFKLAGYASTALPTGAQGGDMIAISDEGYKPAYYDGSDWLYVHDNSAV